MKIRILACCALLVLVPHLGCGEPTDSSPVLADSSPEPAAVCSPTDTIAAVTDLNYPQQDCEAATAMAEEQLGGYHYQKACRETAPDAPSPPGVSAAHVTDCRTTDDRGVFVDVDVCCSLPIETVSAITSVMKADGPSCSVRQTRANARGLHYPNAGSCAEIVPVAENNSTSAHYRTACEEAAPRATRPARVLEARVVECRAGDGVSGVVVDVELCCDAKVFEESEFRELVWQRPPEEIRSALGEPRRITEWPQGPHWTYPLEVARDERVFPEVTVVFVDGRVDSYNF